MNDARLTIGITTRDRPDALQHCLRSLAVVTHLSPEVLVFDDASSRPVTDQLRGWSVPLDVRVIRDDRAPGYIAGRNRLMREASAPLVLLLDDDAALREGEAIERAVRLLDADPRLAAVAFAQCDREGARWDATIAARTAAEPSARIMNSSLQTRRYHTGAIDRCPAKN